MKPYPSYKNSGVKWMGDIPSGWKKKRNKDVLLETKHIVKDSWKDHELLSLTKKGIILRDIESGIGKFPSSFETYQAVEKGDLVFCPYDIEETPRTVGISNSCGMITSSYKILKCKPQIHPKFIFYIYLTLDSFKGLRPHYTGLRNVVRTETFMSLPIYVPNYSEQKQIASFLDRKTQLIDELMEKTEQKIGLLKEKRTSLINHCVSKGLNPNVEMKDSGVEWIGEIPIGWKVNRLKYFSSLVTEKEETKEADIKISPENVESFTGTCSNLYSEYSGMGVPFQSGDILLNKLRLYLGKILLPDYNGYSMGEMIVIRINKPTSNKFYFYLFFDQGLIDLLDSQSTGVKLPRVSPEVIMGNYLPFPSPEEQHQIGEYLDEQTQKIDATIEKETERIELLKEYRQSLIYELVTGKTDVREEMVL